MELNAHRGRTGKASPQAMMIALLAPDPSDQMPNVIPPTIAPTFITTASVPVSVRVEVMLLLQEGRIEVLRAVAEDVERGHQHDQVERDLPVAGKLAKRIWRACSPCAPEGRALLDVHADEEDEKRRRDADEEHAAPADPVEQQEIDEAGDEIAGGIAALEQARHGTAKLGREWSP